MVSSYAKGKGEQMRKAPLGIKRGVKDKDWFTFDLRMSNDKKTLVIRAESGLARNYHTYLHELAAYILKQIEKIEEPTSEHLS